MMNHIATNNFTSIDQAVGKFKRQSAVSERNNEKRDISFESILNKQKSIASVVDEHRKQEDTQVKFTKHAGARLEERDIQLTKEQMSRLEEGTSKASSKGIKESLVLMDNLAFIVNTQSRTVITAIDQKSTEENIYTNIDGAVVI